jgi:glycosyltransferase involved in cell wall biosynthesis
VLPWYYDLSPSRPTTREPGKTLSLGYIGRISEDKGVRRIFEALLDAGITNPIHLVIAGAISGEYATRLFSKYTDHVGKHSVEWMGWIAHREIHRFYQKVDAVLIPSEWIENGPLTLIESAAFKRPVIITDIPTIRSIVQEGHTGYLARFGSTESLSNAIKRASEYPETLIEMGRNMPPVASSIAYASALERIYETVADKMRWSDEQNKMVHGT